MRKSKTNQLWKTGSQLSLCFFLVHIGTLRVVNAWRTLAGNSKKCENIHLLLGFQLQQHSYAPNEFIPTRVSITR